MKKWENFSEEQLKEIIYSSTKYSEALSKIGYSTYTANNHIIRDICDRYNFSLEHFKGTTLNDLIGKEFNRLKVIERDKSKPKGHQKKVYWICQCNCGNIVSVTSYNLIAGITQSCGCLQKERISKSLSLDLTNQRFGKLTVIKREKSIKEKSGQIRTAWLCKCDCGKEVIVKTINLRAGDTNSCGCIYSLGESKIKEILNKMNIKYKSEYSFKDLLTEKGYPMRFDFAIFNYEGQLQCLIEYQGNGHYIQSTWDTPLEERQKRDQIKRDYCKMNDILLIEIPYWDLKDINENYLKEKLKLCTDLLME